MLEWDGVKAAQSNAISRFIAKKVGLYGKDDFEGLLIDSVVELVRDLQKGGQKECIMCQLRVEH